MYTADASFQLIYFAKGSGVIRISGMTGGKALDARVQSGQLLVVPKFFSAAKVADGDGLEYFSVVTSLEPSFVQLAGKCQFGRQWLPRFYKLLSMLSGVRGTFQKQDCQGSNYCSS
nr:uncharacterized protein LOC113736923 [Coffea arabica]XP_027119938.1 uncharacterized protein LOC113736923 [Coffea arabica]